MAFTLRGLFQGKAKEVLDSAFKGLDGLITNKEELAKIKLEAEQEMNRHAEAMEQVALKEIELQNSEMNSARSLQVSALGQSDLFSKRFIYYLASFIVLSSTAFGVMLFFVNVPEQNKRLVEMFADVYLFGGAMLVLSYFFGATMKNQRTQAKSA
jgi:hypothetical protein